MSTTSVLLLLVAASSTLVLAASEGLAGHIFAVDEPAHPWFLVRRKRDIPTASKSGSGAVSFASSSSSAGSTSGSGVAPVHNTFSARSGSLDGAPGYSGVNPGGVAFPAHDYNNYGYGDHNPYYSYGGAGYVPVDFNALFQQYLSYMQRLAQQQAYAMNEIHSRAGYPGPPDFDGSAGFAFPGATNFGGGGGGSVSDGGPVSASASAVLNPRGGFGSASISPPPQGNSELGVRMGSFPASGGPNYSVFTSSSSSSSDENGVKKSSKSATSVVNDNGKVTTFHVSDP